MATKQTRSWVEGPERTLAGIFVPNNNGHKEAKSNPNVSGELAFPARCPSPPGSLCARFGRLPGDGDLSRGNRPAFSRNHQWRSCLPLPRICCGEWSSRLPLGIRLRDGCHLRAFDRGFLSGGFGAVPAPQPPDPLVFIALFFQLFGQ